MKPAAFAFVAPTTVDEVCAVLAEHGDDAKVLAGGQSLGPLMNYRLAVPEIVVDINRVEGLDDLDAVDGRVRIGALVRQRRAERSSLLLRDAPLVPEALRWVGHIGVRNRGTVAGSIAHADPSAEMPAVLLALGGAVRVVSTRGERLIEVADLFSSYFTTSLEPDELLTEVILPQRAPGTGHAWTEYAQRHGDYAIVGVGVSLDIDASEVCRAATVVLIGVDSVPHRATAADALVGHRISAELLRDVAADAAAACDPGTDLVADGEQRRRLVRRLLPQAVQQAAQVARGGSHG